MNKKELIGLGVIIAVIARAIYFLLNKNECLSGCGSPIMFQWGFWIIVLIIGFILLYGFKDKEEEVTDPNNEELGSNDKC